MTSIKKDTKPILFTGILLSFVVISFGMQSAYAEQDEIEQIVERYAQNAELSIQLEKDLAILETVMAQEMSKENIDSHRLTMIQNEIDSVNQKLINSENKAEAIQAELTAKLRMPDGLREKLSEARQIIYDNQEIVPWSGLGTSVTSQSVEVVIPDKNPEKYRQVIEELVGKDVPVTIKEGMSQRTTCADRETDCSYLQAGLHTSTGSTYECTLGFPVLHDGTDYGFLTAGHCFDENDEIYQPTTLGGKIGDVDQVVFVDEGDCDCAFIHQSSLDVWDEHTIYEDENSDYTGIDTNTDPGSTALIAFSGAASDIIDWGYVDSTNWTCDDGTKKTNNLYRTEFTGTQDGDSGAPVFNPSAGVKEFYGTVICQESQFSDDMVFTPWSTIETELNVE